MQSWSAAIPLSLFARCCPTQQCCAEPCLSADGRHFLLCGNHSCPLRASPQASRCVQVGANLGKHGYLPQIAEATADISVQIVFCNAGYMITGFFETKWEPGLVTWCTFPEQR